MIYVLSPENYASGGPELLHQLCYELNKHGLEACMQYYKPMGIGIKLVFLKEAMPQRYSEYHNPIAEKFEDKEENYVVVPETCACYIKKIKHAKILFWWLSVDNYWGSFKDFKRSVNAVLKRLVGQPWPIQEGIIQLCQSKYAYEFVLKNGGNTKSTYMLSDYLNKSYIVDADNNNTEERENIVLYNPMKGKRFTRKLFYR